MIKSPGTISHIFYFQKQVPFDESKNGGRKANVPGASNQGGLSLGQSAMRRWLQLPLQVVLVALLTAISSCNSNPAWADEIFKITAYCPCEICCDKTDGITASGKKSRYGYVACNWLTFNTQVNIDGLGIFSVQDRGARSQFGSYKNKIKHIDIFFPTHKQAKQFGVQYRKVKIL